METNIKHSYRLMILSILFILTLFGLKPVLADTPPYSNIRASHSENPTTLGFGYAFSDSSRDPQAGVIHHIGVTGAHFAGVANIELLDNIAKTFSVSQSGIYLVTFTGRISGGMWKLSSTLVPGASKGATIFQVFGGVFQLDPIYMYETDLSNGALIIALAQSAAITALKLGQIANLLNALSSIIPDPIFNPDIDKFSYSTTVYLDQDIEYSWGFAVWQDTASVALGNEAQVTVLDTTVYLDEVSIDLISPSNGVLTIMPDDGFSASGNQGGPFLPSSKTYTLVNTGGQSLNWSATKGISGADILSLSGIGGTLLPGESTTVTVNINSNADAKQAGIINDIVNFSNTTNGSIISRDMELTVIDPNPSPEFFVEPSNHFEAAGTVGGPFNFTSETYRLNNTTYLPDNIDWRATLSGSWGSDTWVTLSTDSQETIPRRDSVDGTLARQESVYVTVALNNNAFNLPAGSYSETINFVNESNQTETVLRYVNLTVFDGQRVGELVVAPSEGLSSSGTEGGPFYPVSKSYSVANVGTSSFDLHIANGEWWVSPSPSDVELLPGEAKTITININRRAYTLNPGNYDDSVLFHDSGSGDEIFKSVSLTVTPPPSPPTVTPGTPSDGATEVPININVTAVFDKAVEASTISASTFTLTGPDGPVLGTVGYNAATMTATFTPLADFAYDSPFTATVTTGVQDTNGLNMVDDYLWSFSTGLAPDTDPPYVLSTNPVPNDSNIPINYTITATFNEAMDVSTINASTFTLTGLDGPVTGNVSYDSITNTATFIPSSNLTNSTLYAATINTGVKDSADNNLISDHLWIFSTIAENPDSDGDGVPDNEDDYPNDNTYATPQSVTGTGKISVDTSANLGTSLSSVQTFSDSDPSLNQTGKPSNYQFPDGLVSFTINNVPNGGTVTVTITFPTTFPTNAKYYKVDGSGFHEFLNAVIIGKTVTLILTDGGSGDKDGVANGKIEDPGGIAHGKIEDPDAPDLPDGGGSSVSSGSGSVGGCFIATAAFGSYLDPHVMVLRKFRDNHLMTNGIGRAFVKFYYKTSPPVANYIKEHESMKTATRLVLTPVIYGVKYPGTTLVIVLGIGMVFVLIGLCIDRKSYNRI